MRMLDDLNKHKYDRASAQQKGLDELVNHNNVKATAVKIVLHQQKPIGWNI